MTLLTMTKQVRTLGVVLTPYLDGTLRYKAPQGTLTPKLLGALRQHKVALCGLGEAWSERAAIAEYDGRIPRAEAERLAWTCI
jgi:hypothetical protein